MVKGKECSFLGISAVHPLMAPGAHRWMGEVATNWGIGINNGTTNFHHYMFYILHSQHQNKPIVHKG
jgi:hypothetical protein